MISTSCLPIELYELDQSGDQLTSTGHQEIWRWTLLVSWFQFYMISSKLLSYARFRWASFLPNNFFATSIQISCSLVTNVALVTIANSWQWSYILSWNISLFFSFAGVYFLMEFRYFCLLSKHTRDSKRGWFCCTKEPWSLKTRRVGIIYFG